MISKLEVRGFDLDLRHVAGSAILVGYRTTLASAGLCRLVTQ
jgi:hypothetical protein